jgi:23S rRNA (cytosine1962-C5)-methyltransferase
MWDRLQYELLDFGGGRRLERFGPLLLDRPCPACEGLDRAAPELWAAADARFELLGERAGRSSVPPLGQCGGRPHLRGTWKLRGEAGSPWTINHRPLVFDLKRTNFGHVGLFPEQAENWDWLSAEIALRSRQLGRPLKILNLFAYTGGATLAAAAAGAEVTHVDAARNIVAWARRNAELSGLAEAPIRWMAEDAMKFARRELRRGNRYDGVVLDPPSYGHGPRGEPWQLDRHLPELLACCAELLAPAPRFVLLTCHTPSYPAERLCEMLAGALDAPASTDVIAEAAELALRTAAGRVLPCGSAARWASEEQ